jgi:hypothetical protein
MIIKTDDKSSRSNNKKCRNSIISFFLITTLQDFKLKKFLLQFLPFIGEGNIYFIFQTTRGREGCGLGHTIRPFKRKESLPFDC